MVTIAALIDAPGLGQVVVKAIESLNIGVAFNAGLAIVVMAIVLDRTTTAVSMRTEKERRSGHESSRRRRLVVYAVGIVLAVVRHRPRASSTCGPTRSRTAGCTRSRRR